MYARPSGVPFYNAHFKRRSIAIVTARGFSSATTTFFLASQTQSLTRDIRFRRFIMRILYLTNYFPPEVGTGPHLPYELGEWLINDGHDVTVVTGFPRYNLPVMPARYRRRLFYRETMAGMDVLRINAPNFYGQSRWSRGLAQILTPPLIAARALSCSRPDVVITDSPPLLLAAAARWISIRFRVPLVVYIMDLFPQTIIDAGLLRNRFIISFFERMERNIYNKAAALSVLSEGNRQCVIDRGAEPDKVSVIPTWADTDAIRPSEQMNEFRRTHDLKENFVVLFAGTMGFFQGLGTVIDAARQLVNEPNLMFLLVGDGVEREKLQKQAAGLSNVKFLPMQPKDVYPQVLAACDVALVILRPEVTTPTVPSKLMTIMAAGRPVLASLSAAAGADVTRRIGDAQCGLVVPAGNATELAAAILTIKHGPEGTARTMGLNGRSYVETHLSRDVSMRKLREVLAKVVAVPTPILDKHSVS